MSSVPPPSQFLIFNDTNFIEAELTSVSSYARLRIDVASANSANQGNLNLFCIGDNISELRNYNFRIQTSGSENTGAWIWQNQADTTRWYGEPDRRHIHSFGNGGVTDIAHHATGTYCTNYNRLMLYYGKANNQIGIRYKDLNVEEDVWSEEVINFPDEIQSGIQIGAINEQNNALDVCELSDGTMLMVVRADNDLHILSSIDGLTWSVYADKITSRFANIKREFLSVRMASSGNYVRIVAVAPSIQRSGANHSSQYPIVSLVSADSGATWAMNEFDLEATQKSPTGEYRFALDLCSFDNNGTFVFSTLTQRSGKIGFDVYLASGLSSPSLVEDLNIACMGGKNIYLCNHSDWIVAVTVHLSSRSDLVPDFTEEETNYIQGAGSITQEVTQFTNYEYSFQYLKKSDNPSGSMWENLSEGYAISGFYGAMRMLPECGKLFSSSDSLHWFHGIRDKQLPLFVGMLEGGAYKKIGGWETRPIKDVNIGNFSGSQQESDYYINKHQPRGRLYIPDWNTHLGTPQGGYSGTEDSVWQAVRDGATTARWNTENIRLRNSSSSSNNHIYYLYTDPAYYNEYKLRSAAGSNMGAVGATHHGTGVYRDGGDASPDRNWCFVPDEIDISKAWNEQPHGSCVIWEGKYKEGVNADPLAEDYMVVGISSYLKTTNTTKRVNCTVRHSNSDVVVYDTIGGAPLATLSPNVGTYGADPFKNNYWEFRWAWYPYIDENNSSETACILMCRQVGTTDWISTDVLSPDTSDFDGSVSSSDKTYNQMLYFGNMKNNRTQESYWKRLSIHPNNDLGTFAYEQANWTPVNGITALDAIRGRVISSSPDIFDTELQIRTVWGGSSGIYNDMYQANMRYEYPPTNMNKHKSPRIQYRTETYPNKDTSQNVSIVFEAQGDQIFYHDSIALINTNIEQAQVSYSFDGNTWELKGSLSPVRTPIGSRGIVTGVTNNIISIDFENNDLLPSEITSNDKKKYYLRLLNHTAGGTYQCYEISRSYGNSVFQINSENINVSAIDVGIVGSTVAIYGDKCISQYGSHAFGKYMKIEILNAQWTSELYSYIGSIVAGNKFTFDTAIRWEFSDTEKANQQEFRSRSGIRWSYNQGVSERELSLNMEGDVSNQNTRTLRDQIKSVHGYGENNLVFVTETLNYDPDMIFHCQFDNNTAVQNQGWYYDEANGRWLPVTDLGLKFIEVV